jgi:hypothetical protein
MSCLKITNNRVTVS